MTTEIEKRLHDLRNWLEQVKAATDAVSLESIRSKCIGRNGELAEIMRSLRQALVEERPRLGQLANEVKQELETAIGEKEKTFQAGVRQQKLVAEKIDITLPGWTIKNGRLHPLTQVMEQAKAIFLRLGYAIAEGPEVEKAYYNFTALNIPQDHPASDMHDTFYVGQTSQKWDDQLLLRTHTSPVQVRVMEKQKPPIKVISPGRVYRRDADVTHSPVFHQVEGLLVDENTTMADLKGTLTYFLHQMFGRQRKVRFRPSYFPFTEPSAEVDVECLVCGGSGCRSCKNTGWLEILGSGMVDPTVLAGVGIDPEKYQGFAFGMGMERIAMLKYGIPDIRMFFENDLRFLEEF